MSHLLERDHETVVEPDVVKPLNVSDHGTTVISQDQPPSKDGLENTIHLEGDVSLLGLTVVNPITERIP